MSRWSSMHHSGLEGWFLEDHPTASNPGLVGGLEHFYTFFTLPYLGNNSPNWLSYFSEGLKAPTSGDCQSPFRIGWSPFLVGELSPVKLSEMIRGRIQVVANSPAICGLLFHYQSALLRGLSRLSSASLVGQTYSIPGWPIFFLQLELGMCEH